MGVGKNIREKRLQMGITQKALAEMAGIPQITLRQYEAEKYSPKFETLEKIAKALGIRVRDLQPDEKTDQFNKEFEPFAPYLKDLTRLGITWRFLGSFDAVTGAPIEDPHETLGIRYNEKWIPLTHEQAEKLFSDIDTSIEFHIWKLWKENEQN